MMNFCKLLFAVLLLLFATFKLFFRLLTLFSLRKNKIKNDTLHVDYVPGGEALGYFLGGYVPPGTPNLHPVLKKIPLKLIPRFRNGPNFFILRSRKFVNRNSPVF